MNSALLLLGTLCYSVTATYRSNPWVGFVATAIGGAALAMGNREKALVIGKLPRIIPPGSLAAGVLSVSLALVGLAAGTLTNNQDFLKLHPIAGPATAFLSYVSLMFFNKEDLAGLKGAGAGPAMLALFLLGASCHQPPINWPRFVKCEAQAAVANFDQLAASVSRILLTGGATWEKELEGLARTYGADAVACAVEELRRDWSSPGRSADPAVATGLDRSSSFLTTHNITVTQ